MYHILVETNNASEAKIDEFLDYVDSMEEVDTAQMEEDTRPAISLHVMLGIVGYQTMMIQGKIKNKLVIF